MAITTRLDLRQTQTLVMTPQLQQAIKLLQMSNLELADYVEGEIEQNPLLERDEGPEDGPQDASGSAGDAIDPADGEEADGEPIGEPGEPVDPARREVVELTSEASMGVGAEAPLDTDYENLWSGAGPSDTDGPLLDSPAHWRAGRSGSFDDPEFNFEQTLSHAASLRDHLVEQLGVDLADPVDRMIGVHLIDLLDEAGYLLADLTQAAEQLGCAASHVEATLARLQEFDPPGVFARNLRECLALQLRDRGRLDPAMERVLSHLELVAKREVAALCRLCGVSSTELAAMVAEIRSLDPKPGLAFDQTVAQPITPDVIMRPHPNGGWQIELNSDTLPSVLVNASYYARISREVKSKTERSYLSERLQSANWLVKSLHQRATTILRVATEIVRQQDPFFRRGVQHLRPLVLRDIAAAIDMHESTVSRVTNNKYMATPRGVFELKYFFTAAIPSSEGGEAHSAEAVRFRIRALIERERADDVLSDDRIVEVLRKEGIDIARRTVAKYREALHIPSSARRRRLKSAAM